MPAIRQDLIQECGLSDSAFDKFKEGRFSVGVYQDL